MGLLDNLVSGGSGGGLLDFLRFNALNQQMQSGLPSDQAQYAPMAPQGRPSMLQPPNQPSPLDTAQWPQGPVGAPSQANAQMPAPSLAPAQPAPQEPGIGDRFMAGAQSFFGNPGGGVIPNLLNGITGFQTGQPVGGRNQTAQFLVAKGIDPALARTIVSDPQLLRSVLPQVMGIGGQTDDIKEYQFAKRENPSLTFEKFMQQKKAVSGEYSLTPQYGTNEKGETVLIQTGKSGEAIQTKLPAGVKISSGVDKIDLGTSWGLVDKRTGQMIGQQAKDIEGKESAEERGKARGQAEVALPNVIANADQTLKIIQSIKDDPYRARGTGASSVFNAIPATGGFDFAQKVEQLKGKAFLEAFQSLKGGGAITEIEGKKAENAIARLNVKQSEEAFSQALNELEEVVTAGIERAKARAGKGGGASSGAPSAATQSSTIPEGATATNPQTGQKITFRNGRWQ